MKSVNINSNGFTGDFLLAYLLDQELKKNGFLLGDMDSIKAKDYTQPAYTLLKPHFTYRPLTGLVGQLQKNTLDLLYIICSDLPDSVENNVNARTGVSLRSLPNNQKFQGTVEAIIEGACNPAVQSVVDVPAWVFLDSVYSRSVDPNGFLIETSKKAMAEPEMIALTCKLNNYFNKYGINATLKVV